MYPRVFTIRVSITLVEFLNYLFRWLRRTAIAALVGVSLLPGNTQAARHALLIGVGDYSESGVPNLPSVKNVELMETVIRKRFGSGAEEGIQIKVLKDEEATHLGIQAAFENLAQQVQPGDFVYLYYMGHGSEIADLNGDETRTGKDQTWVSYGARSAKFEGLDHYDILDDELNLWLRPIADRAQQVVLVSDTCHSATITRGDAGPMAGAPPIQGEHPLGRQPYHPHDLGSVVTISAARDNERAQLLDDTHALFTWNWVRSIEQAEVGESWEQIFERARVWMRRTHGQSQNPQISGARRTDPAFGGAITHLEPDVMVKDVSEGNQATLGVGYLVGATRGSVYAPLAEGSPVRVRLTEVNDTYSKAEVVGGRVEAGDHLREIEHVYESAPLKIFVAGDSPETQKELLARLRDLFPTAANPKQGLSGFMLEDSQRQADLVLYLIQPKRQGNGDYVYRQTAQGRQSLPESDPQVVPEVWVLTRKEQLVHEHLRVRMVPVDIGLERLKTNLQRYRRVRALEGLAENQSGLGRVKVYFLTYARCVINAPDCLPCAPRDTSCHEPENHEYRYRQVGRLSPEELTKRVWNTNDTISFQLENTGPADRFIYLLDLDANGRISVLFPSINLPGDEARLPGKKTRDLSQEPIKIGLLLDQPGEGGVIAIAAGDEIANLRLLEQEGYEAVRKGGPSSNSIVQSNHPIVQLLQSAIDGTRSRDQTPVKVPESYQLGQQFFRYKVKSSNALSNE